MNKLILFASLVVCTSIYAAQTYELTYKGFPYAKTTCENPTYAYGEQVILSVGKPQQDGKNFLYWQHAGVNYLPGATFTMPAADVELIPVYDTNTAVDNLHAETKRTKVLQNGQLIIIHNGKSYNSLGQQIQ